jgi:hypothetical protein
VLRWIVVGNGTEGTCFTYGPYHSVLLQEMIGEEWVTVPLVVTKEIKDARNKSLMDSMMSASTTDEDRAENDPQAS